MSIIKSLQTSFIKRLLFRVLLEGESMWPELVPGKTYWASGISKPKIGDFIIFSNPKSIKEIFIKRVKNICFDSYVVEGLVSWSKGSKDFGPVSGDLVLGKIIWLK